jgi:ATP-dependent DNA ligase
VAVLAPCADASGRSVRLPAVLPGSMVFEEARTIPSLARGLSLLGGTRYEPRWGGCRAAMVKDEGRVWIYSARWNDVTDRFGDLVAVALAVVPDGLVLDGEICVLRDCRLSGDALGERLRQRCLSRRTVNEDQALFMAYDLLATRGIDLRSRAWRIRRDRLEELAVRWDSVLHLSPVTKDCDAAAEWLRCLPRSFGTRGLLVKGAAQAYTGGRSWLEVRAKPLTVAK